RPGAAPRYLHLSTFGGRLQTATNGATFGHPGTVNGLAVAAVNVATAGGGVFVGGGANPTENFSSDGPRRVFTTAAAAPITPGNFSSTGGTVRQKPDLAAADGVSTATPGFKPFFGTSAAAPHAAAITALVLQTRPDIVAMGNASATTAVRDLLTATTLDIE